MPLSADVQFGVLLSCVVVSIAHNWSMCPGSVGVSGYGPVSLTNAGLNTERVGGKAANVKIHADGTISPQMNSRTYFSDECTAGVYNNTKYVGLKLLGRKLKYSVDLSGAGCGCNAALYLTSLPQNSQKSTCMDYYCDANSVCGVACAEIDIQEANEHAWHSTLHAWDDGMGMASVGGYGGNQARDWTAKEYGIGGECIDTSKPFQVAVAFPVNADGVLEAMEIELTQEGHSCPLSISIAGYKLKGRDGMMDMTKALADGMTPIISYWNSDKMQWLDGIGEDFKGPCGADHPSTCSESIHFSNFSVEPICTERCPVGNCHKDESGMCIWFTNAGAESYHCKIANCSEAPAKSETISNCWDWKGESFYSIEKRDAMCQDDWHKQQRERLEIPPVRERQPENGKYKMTAMLAAGAVVAVAAAVAMGLFVAWRLPKQADIAANQGVPASRNAQVANSHSVRSQGTLRLVSSREILLIEPEETIV